MMDARLQEQSDNAIQHISLGNNKKVALHRDSWRELSVGQLMNFEKGTLVTLELDISYTAADQSIMELSFETSDLTSSKTGKSFLPVLKLPSISDGERMLMRIAFPVFSNYSHAQMNLWARSLLTDGAVTVHQYRISTEKKKRFDSLSLELLDGEVTAANGNVEKIYRLKQGPGSHLTFVIQSSVYKLGSTESLSSEQSFLKYGGGGWWGGESWGRWSKQNSELNFFLGHNSATNESELLLTIQAKAYTSMSSQQVEVWGNGELLDTWEMSSKSQLFKAVVPASLLEQGFLSINFVLLGSLVSPEVRTGKSKDKRKLGIGLINFTLSRLQ